MSPPALHFEHLNGCPVCAATHSRERFTSPDLLMGVPGNFRYVECGVCRTVYQNPRVKDEDMALCYPADYFTHGGCPWVPTPAPVGSIRDQVRRAIRAAADRVPDGALSPGLRVVGWLLARHPGLRRRARLGLVDPLAAPLEGHRRCLEVGPGQGIGMYCLQELGWEVYGLEVDPIAAVQARATSGCEVRVGTLSSTDYADGYFDLVYMSHVFEHLADPVSSLRRCLQLLRHGGRLVLLGPNPNALTAHYYGVFSLVWDSPRHLVLPTLEATSDLWSRIGFEGVQGRTLAGSAVVNAEAARRRRCGENWSPLQLQPPRLLGRVFAIIESILMAFGASVGEELLVHARKPENAA